MMFDIKAFAAGEGMIDFNQKVALRIWSHVVNPRIDHPQ